MIRPFVAAFILFAVLGIESAQAQGAATFKRFVVYKQIVADVDFFASNRPLITPYEKPVAETIARLKTLFGENIPRGAIFICSTLEQKDSIYEPMVLKMGYGWTLTAITPEVRMQETMERIKSQMGGEVPAEIMARIKNRSPEMAADAEKQLVSTTTRQVAYAVIQTLENKELKFRSSRVDDMGKSPLPDWLDIGIASYATGSQTDLVYLQQHMDQTFPIEDVIAMSRPFVASSGQTGGGDSGARGGGPPGGGQGMPGGMPGGMPPGGFSGRSMGSGGGSGGSSGPRGPRVIPKDEQDRMVFDGQATSFFMYLMERVGIEKVKQLISHAQEGKESRDFISQTDVLGPNFSKIEEDWTGWVKALKLPAAQQRQGLPGSF